MTAVVFETPGLIDLRAFTIMGAHAKPNASNPIGFFGTGLKYAIAVAVRLGDEPVVWVGRDKITFSKHAGKFRGTDLETIRMSVLKDGNKRATHFELPFTTRYGARWEPWMAFRELESNTRDEKGSTWVADADGPAVAGIVEALARTEGGKTFMVFSAPEIVEAARAIDAIFLPRAKREGTLLEAIDADDRPLEEDANFIFYRTMRAMKTDKPMLNTYNILESCRLTEDRTLAYNFEVRNVLARWVLTEATEEQVEAIVTADEEWWEHGLEFPGHVAPSEAFRAVMLRRPKGLSRYASGYWSGYTGGSTRITRKVTFRLFSECPTPWRLSGDFVFDANKEPVFERPDDMYSDTWDEVALAIIGKVGATAAASEELPEAPCPPAPESVEKQGDDSIF
jgi:hypothetical protein